MICTTKLSKFFSSVTTPRCLDQIQIGAIRLKLIIPQSRRRRQGYFVFKLLTKRQLRQLEHQTQRQTQLLRGCAPSKHGVILCRFLAL